MADVLVVPTLQFRDPVPFLVLVKACDLTFHRKSLQSPERELDALSHQLPYRDSQFIKNAKSCPRRTEFDCLGRNQHIHPLGTVNG
jgi:hypothetical protein